MQTPYFNLRLGILNMHLLYARTTVSNYDVVVNRIWMLCLYVNNNMAHDQEILSK